MVVLRLLHCDTRCTGYDVSNWHDRKCAAHDSRNTNRGHLAILRALLRNKLSKPVNPRCWGAIGPVLDDTFSNQLHQSPASAHCLPVRIRLPQDNVLGVCLGYVPCVRLAQSIMGVVWVEVCGRLYWAARRCENTPSWVLRL